MNDKSKLLSVFALGALAGVAVIKLLESDKGKEFIESAKNQAASKAEEIKRKINELETELAEFVKSQEESTHNTV